MLMLGLSIDEDAGDADVDMRILEEADIDAESKMEESETIRYSRVSLRNKNSLDPTSLTDTDNLVPPEALAAHAAWVKGQKDVAVLMLLTMDLEIQRNLAHLGAYDMLQELKALYSKQAEQELLQTDYDSFVQNYIMHGMGKTVNELHAMLKLHEDMLLKKDANPALHAIRSGRVQKNQNKKPYKAAKKGKMGYAPNNVPFDPKPKTPPPPRKDNPAKDAICHQCGKVGH
ncbi:hypothetical protein Tco_0117845 [Tanacetum coccineum]